MARFFDFQSQPHIWTLLLLRLRDKQPFRCPIFSMERGILWNVSVEFDATVRERISPLEDDLIYWESLTALGQCWMLGNSSTSCWLLNSANCFSIYRYPTSKPDAVAIKTYKSKRVVKTTGSTNITENIKARFEPSTNQNGGAVITERRVTSSEGTVHMVIWFCSNYTQVS